MMLTADAPVVAALSPRGHRAGARAAWRFGRRPGALILGHHLIGEHDGDRCRPAVSAEHFAQFLWLIPQPGLGVVGLAQGRTGADQPIEGVARQTCAGPDASFPVGSQDSGV